MSGRKSKFVVITHPVLRCEMPVILPECLGHDTLKLFSPISAGFCSLTADGVSVWGRSDSLNLDSRPGIDADLLWVFFGMRPGDVNMPAEVVVCAPVAQCA